jgi:hypothetical protein
LIILNRDEKFQQYCQHYYNIPAFILIKGKIKITASNSEEKRGKPFYNQTVETAHFKVGKVVLIESLLYAEMCDG